MSSIFNRQTAFTMLFTACACVTTLSAHADDAVDVQKLLNANGCFGCHSVDKKIVGPAFHDVAAKYAGDAEAASEVAANIRSGGVGRWGQVPMPPMRSLSGAETAALADFVLKQ